MKNVFVFPYGSEIALEIARALLYDTHFHLIGGGSIKDHGRFVFSDRVENLPWESSPDFLPTIRQLVKDHNIDLIYPAMDSSILYLKKAESFLGCKVVGPDLPVTEICLSKRKTYELLADIVNTPQIYSIQDQLEFPVFGKPEVGYGSRGCERINSSKDLQNYLKRTSDALICEYLPGEEYTVDCFSDRHGKLRFCGPRVRGRTMNGISVYTHPVECTPEFREVAEAINRRIHFRGAWFFQMKRNASNQLTLLEIAARFGGSSSLYRALGINFPKLTLWDALDSDISITEQKYFVEMDRALDNRFKMNIYYNEVFLDFDDTLWLNKSFYNPILMHFLFQCKNRKISITLLSKHEGDLESLVAELNIAGLFDRIIQLSPSEDKSRYIDNHQAIFIDDSFAEREKVRKDKKIPVFDLDMISALIEERLP